MAIAKSMLDLVGNTPMVYLDRLRDSVNGGAGARVAAKLEMFNPGFSVKDRIGRAMIRAGRDAGLLKDGGTIVEPTSGNTGLGLAMAAAVMGYQMVATVPDKVPLEKIRLLEAYGARVIVCPTNVEADDPRSYYKQAERLRDEEGAYLPYQYHNAANPQAHYKTTGPEVWQQTEGRVTHFVAGMGTGGTISGTGRYLHRAAKKAGLPRVQVVGVDTVGSIYTEYFRTRKFPKDIHQYLIDGIGEDFLPSTVWWDEVDGVVQVTDDDAFLMMARMAREEAVFSGSSAGAAVHAALQVAKKLPKSALVVTLIPDAGERYLSKFNIAWMESKNLTKAPKYLRSLEKHDGAPAPSRGATKAAPAKAAAKTRAGASAGKKKRLPKTLAAPLGVAKNAAKRVRRKQAR